VPWPRAAAAPERPLRALPGRDRPGEALMDDSAPPWRGRTDLPALEAQVQLEPRRIGIPGAGRIVAPVTAKTRCRTKPAERVLDR